MASFQKLDLYEIEQSLHKISEFLVPCLPLANAHATDFITKNHWSSLVPAEIRAELLQLSSDQLGNLSTNVLDLDNRSCTEERPTDSATEEIIGKNAEMTSNITELNESQRVASDKFDSISIDAGSITINNRSAEEKGQVTHFPYSNLTDFIQVAKSCSVEGLRIAISPDELMEKLGCHGDKDVFVGTFMNQKKIHEVEVMSRICSSLVEHFDCKLVVDFGSGKGYLGNHLSLQYGLPVLGIDAARSNTQSAEKRNTILDKQWESLARNKMLETQGTKLTKRERKKLKEQNRTYKKTDFAEGKLKTSGFYNNDCDKTAGKASYETEIFVANKKQFEGEEVNETNEKSEEVALHRLSINETKVNKFVPCTTFIDTETNFIKLAKLHFPEIFDKVFNGMEPEVNKSAHGRNIDQVVLANVDGVGEKLAMMQNQSKKLHSDVMANQFSDTADETKSGTDPNDQNVGSVSDVCESENRSKGSLVKEVVTDESDTFKIMLTGLHTCGNLASTSMDIFVHSNQLKVLCNVGCCYHLLDEKFSEKKLPQDSNAPYSGFPLSKCLTRRRFQLGNTARNLAAQALHRISDFDKLQGERFYPRALLEVLIRDVCGPAGVLMKGLRKLEQKCKSTQEYIRKACDKLGISDKVPDHIVASYIEKHADDQHRLAAFFQLKTVLAPCIESLILLDRVCFLLEQEQVTAVYLVKMFDPVISPRCYGIVAVK